LNGADLGRAISDRKIGARRRCLHRTGARNSSFAGNQQDEALHSRKIDGHMFSAGRAIWKQPAGLIRFSDLPASSRFRHGRSPARRLHPACTIHAAGIVGLQ
jgi:hypothetical protein